jgi:hypothetical protein
MEDREWRFVDKSNLAPGPWQSEPDKIQWTDEATGLPCLIHRNPGPNHLCGYVGVTAEHPYYQKDDSEIGDIEAHGGVNYADFCAENVTEEGRGICHVPSPGEPDKVWWFGFDCGHYGDVSPGYDRDGRYGYDSTYKTVAYVKSQCRRLAAQLAEVKPEV